MRRTIRIDEELLARQRPAATHEPVRLITFGSAGLRPDVDVDDSASLLDLMDEPSDSD